MALRDFVPPNSGFGSFCGGVLLGFFVAAIFLVRIFILPGRPNEVIVTYTDFAALLLTAVAVLVTVLGVIVAILALYGFRAIRLDARRAAGAAGLKHVADSLGKDGELRKILESRVDALIAEATFAQEEWGNDGGEDGDTTDEGERH